MDCRNFSWLPVTRLNALAIAWLTLVSMVLGQSTETVNDLDVTLTEVLAGHSSHGEAFNEGPRQSAYLMGGTGNVNFPVTTKSALAQKFINQGIGQLHGFWFLEAERSFRQAAALDESCAMAYWGAAWATAENSKRAQGFIAKAMELKQSVSERDRLYIEALSKYLSDKPEEKSKRAADFLKDLESIALKFPEDLEAKALIAHRVWQNSREGIPVSSYLAVDALLQQVFAAEPLHPAHHYAIHLWDNRAPEKALRSSAQGGISAPSIAHMWHMPGHIYSQLHRYEDAIYQQEASARVDHAHMIRDRIMPDEIHNFAHNNEWLIRNLSFAGRANDALELAKNMVELPQHPKYNDLKKANGSASYGRRRLLQVLREYELFDQAIGLCQSPYLAAAGLSPEDRIKCLRLSGCAAAIAGQPTGKSHAVAELELLSQQQRTLKADCLVALNRLKSAIDTSEDRPPLAEKMEIDPAAAATKIDEKKSELAAAADLVGQIGKSLTAVEGYTLVAQQDYKTAYERLLAATGEDVSWLGELQFDGGNTDEGLKTVQEQVTRRPKEVLPLARLAFMQFQNGDVADAEKTFQQLRETSSSFDLTLPIFGRLKPLADLQGLETDWRKPVEPASDLGFRPALESLGPFRWSPPLAPVWSIIDSSNQTAGSSEFHGQPYVLIFYLGHGCLHCAEQLNAFAPHVGDFEKAGIKMLAISSDNSAGLQQSIESFTGEMPFRLASDETLQIFKKFRAFDDFENKPLHGTFLVDGAGKIRWQDIGYRPFMEHDFLLLEAQRLLADGLPIVVAAIGQ